MASTQFQINYNVYNSDSFSKSSQTNFNEKNKKLTVRELTTRPGLLQQIDRYIVTLQAEQAQNLATLHANFLSKINTCKLKLPSSPTKSDFKKMAHTVFDLYRKEMIERACLDVEQNLENWSFTNRVEWNTNQAVFKDFMWIYIKSVYSSLPEVELAEVLKKEFPSLPQNFLPCLYEVTDSKNIEAHYPLELT